jgi:hypothetical protein
MYSPMDQVTSLLSAGEHARGMDVVRDDSVLADTHLPRKFAKDKVGVGVRCLEVLVDLTEVIG